MATASLAMWIWNPTRHRMEQWVYDGTGAHIQSAVVDPRVDQSDLGSVTTMPLDPDMLPRIDAAAAGDPDGIGFLSDLIGQMNTEQAGGGAAAAGGGSGQQAGTVPLRTPANQVVADANRLSSAFSARAQKDALDQQQTAIETEMRQMGQDPAYWWNYVGAGQPARGDGGQPTSDASTYGDLGPDYTNAYTRQDEVANQGALLKRTEDLQRLSNAWEAHKEGAKFLTDYGDLSRQIEQGEVDLRNAEMWASSKAENDKQIAPGPGNSWLHGGNAAGARDLVAARQQRSRMLAARDPNAYVAQRQQEISPTSSDYILGTWGLHRDASGKVVDAMGNEHHQYFNPEGTNDYASGGQIPAVPPTVPRFAAGGDMGYGYLDAGGAGWNSNPLPAPPAGPAPVAGGTTGTAGPGADPGETYRLNSTAMDTQGAWAAPGVAGMAQDAEAERLQQQQYDQAMAQAQAQAEAEIEMIRQDEQNQAASLRQQFAAAIQRLQDQQALQGTQYGAQRYTLRGQTEDALKAAGYGTPGAGTTYAG